MRRRGARLALIAAWLGVIALGLDAIVPVHLAFDLAERVAAVTHQAGAVAAERGFSWRLLALLSGHRAGDDSPDHGGKHHRVDCAVCSSLGTLAGFAPTPVLPFVAPLAVAAAPPRLLIARAPHQVAAAAYRSRAPPIA
ncbi:MAG: DUF2946 family protein [Stellaceae bacterium]